MNMDGVSYDPSVIVASILAFKSESEELLTPIASNFLATMLMHAGGGRSVSAGALAMPRSAQAVRATTRSERASQAAFAAA